MRTISKLLFFVCVVFNCLPLFAQGHESNSSADLRDLVVISDIDDTLFETLASRQRRIKTSAWSSLLTLVRGQSNQLVELHGVVQALLDLQKRGAKIVFLSGRTESERQHTIDQLEFFGFKNPDVRLSPDRAGSLYNHKAIRAKEIMLENIGSRFLLFGDNKYDDPMAYAQLKGDLEVGRKILGILIRAVYQGNSFVGQFRYRSREQLMAALASLNLFSVNSCHKLF